MQIEVPFSSYKYLRCCAFFAGLLGVAQSLAWLGMSITAILAYFCNIDFAGITANYGTALRVTIFQMYFRGDCTPSNFPVFDFSALNNLDLMTPSFVNIWMWVVAALSLIWLFSSVTLMTNIKKSNIRYMNVFLYIWIFITFVISMIDLVLFIMFILDYDTIIRHSYDISSNFAVSTSTILITAQNTAGMMASIALRGYLLWLINLVLCIYLFTQTFRIYDYNRTSGLNPTGHANGGFKADNELQGHSIFKNQPISAFEAENLNKTNPWYNYLTTDIPRVQRPNSHFPPPLERSKSATNLEEVYQRRLTSATGQSSDVVLRREQVHKELKNRHSSNSLGGYVVSPAVVQASNYEARPPLRSALRNSRYN